MAAEDYNWDSRLCVKFKPTDGSSSLISPINSITPTIDTPSDIIDSIDGCNLGRSKGNPRYTVEFEVQALNFSVHRQILSSAIKGATFDIVWATLDGQPDSWVVDSITLTDCAVTSSVPTIDNTNKTPTIKFQANALGLSASNNGEVITTDTVGSASGSLS